MADCRNQDMGYAAPKKTTPNNNKNIVINPSPVFNRSMTINASSSSSSAAAGAAENKPRFNIFSSQTFQRNGSIKSSHTSAFDSFKGKVRKLRSMFDSPKHASSSPNSSPMPSPKIPSSEYSSSIASSPISDSTLRLPGTEERVVIFFTSLRGIRRTFQDCHSIRMIFRGFRVNLDERDISMDAAYKNEFHKLLGENTTLPQVFIKGKYVGGADLIKQMLETGELKKVIKGLPLRNMKPCDACDDVRFLPCMNCNGSRKVFDEEEDQPKRCLECNENGLVRCPLCCL